MEGKSKARQEGSRRNRNSKVNISDVDRERESRGSVCAAAIWAEGKAEEKEEMQTKGGKVKQIKQQGEVKSLWAKQWRMETV